jgi:hypothetical protein
MSRTYQTAVTKVAQKIASSTNPTVKLIAHSILDKGLARVVVDVIHNRHSQEHHDSVATSLSNLFENKLVAVAGSFNSIDKAPYSERIEGCVRTNTESVVYTEGMKGFRSISANIFSDVEDKMWVLKKTESGDLLVKGTGIEDHDSLKHLLDVACCSGYSLSSDYQRSVSSLSAMHKGLAGGDFVSYVSPKSAEVRYGFIVAEASDSTSDKLLIIPQDNPDTEPEAVNREAVSYSYDQNSFPELELSEQERMDQAVSSARGVVDLNELLEYYRKVYRRGSGFYAEFAKRARAHAFM